MRLNLIGTIFTRQPTPVVSPVWLARGEWTRRDVFRGTTCHQMRCQPGARAWARAEVMTVLERSIWERAAAPGLLWVLSKLSEAG